MRPCWIIPEAQATFERAEASVEAIGPEATAGPAFYPPADRTAQWFGDAYPGVDMGGVEKIILHTTETGGWPGYVGGASAPTLTYDPRQHEWRQHFILYRSARALRDPSDTLVRENRDKVVQVEIVACSDHGFADQHGYLDVQDMDDQALRELAAFIRFCHVEFGVPLVTPAVWLDYPASYGATSVRMSGPEFDAFRGVLGHEHVSGNSHGDPDLIPISAIMKYAGGDDMPLNADDKVWIQKALVAERDDIARKVWDLDYIPAFGPDGQRIPDVWVAKNVLSDLHRNVTRLLNAPPADVDEAALAAALAPLLTTTVSGFTDVALAALAAAVANEQAARLAQ